MKESNCPTCRRPKAAASRGSLTQWVTSCTCHLKLPDNPQAISIHFCRTCGKRIGEGRPGSFTQYIFRFDTCRCEIPEPGGQAVASASPAIDQAADDYSDDDEPALEITCGRFPVDRYKPLATLGQGSSGTVFLARDKLLRKKVAVKVLHGLAPEQVIGFQEEARATSRLRHDGIVKLLDFGLIESSIPYMVLEYVSGQSLKETLLQSGPIPWQRSVYMVQRLCVTLQYAHEQGVFHRDIQPSNIIVTREPDDSLGIRLIDFGIAKIVGNSIDSAQSDSLDLVGTPFYMSPDQSLGRKYDARSEVYSLGCVLFECLTGRPPFQGQTALETLSMHAEQTLPKLDEAYQPTQPDTVSEKAYFPESLEMLVERCLAKDSEDRYKSMADLLNALEEISRSAIGQTDEKDGVRRMASQPRRARRIVQAIAIACFCLTGVIIAWQFNKSPAPESQPGVNTSSSGSAVLKEIGDALVIEPQNKVKRTQAISTTIFQNANWAREESAGTSATSKKLTELIDPSATKVTVHGFFDDKYFADLAQYKSAKFLDLSSNKLTDSGTANICSPKLTVLKLDNTLVKTLEHVSKLKSLESLTLTNTMVDNQAMARLCSLKKLEFLDISKTHIDDGAIKYLRKLRSLSSMACGQTLSKAAVQALAKEMPVCTITVGGQTIPGISDRDLESVVKTRSASDAIGYLSNCVSTIEKAQGKDAPQLARLLTPLADCYYHARKLKEAKTASERAIRICRDNDNLRWILPALVLRESVANAESNTGDIIKYKSEMCTLMKQVDANPKSLLVTTSSLAGSLVRSGDNERAKKEFQSVIKQAETLSQTKEPLTPEETSKFVAVAWHWLARISYDNKDFGAAEKQMRKAINILRVNPDHASKSYPILLSSCYVRLASSNIANHHYDEAIANQKECINVSKKYQLPGVENQESCLEIYQRNKHAANGNL